MIGLAKGKSQDVSAHGTRSTISQNTAAIRVAEPASTRLCALKRRDRPALRARRAARIAALRKANRIALARALNPRAFNARRNSPPIVARRQKRTCIRTS